MACRKQPGKLSFAATGFQLIDFYVCAKECFELYSLKKIKNELMKQVNSYLTFNGNCREAMTFYKKCLGGELVFQTIGESPLSDKMPVQMKKSILHATLTNGNTVIMGSDMVGSKGLTKGNAVSMMLDCNSEKEIRTIYKKLSNGGEATHPLEVSFWGALFGDLTDKYGNNWVLHYDMNRKK